MADLGSTRIFGKLTVMHDAHCKGDITATGTVSGSSDIRLKDNIVPIGDALDKVCGLSGYTFTFKEDDSALSNTGVIAQEVIEVLPEAVRKGPDGFYTVAYGNLAGLLIEAVKEERSKRESLEARLERLEALTGV